MNNVVGLPRVLGVGMLFLFSAIAATPQTPARHREFPPGAVKRVDDLPGSRLRTRIEGLPAAARGRALDRLRNFHFTDLDLNSLEADNEGGIFYADKFPLDAAAQPAGSELVAAQAAVPVNPFPPGLIFHSRPGAPNVLYLNFGGETVTGTMWNNSIGRGSISAVAFSTDSDDSTFSDAEQLAIKRIWQRVSEDYAPFNIDVTTERPAMFTTRTAHALITRSTDAGGYANPSSNAGGVAYMDVFGNFDYASSRPAWIYYNNVANNESFVAEAASHEVGHNLGLSHDGKTDGAEYYTGHGTGDTSWAPIMGASYNHNVSQWSKGDYYLANNRQDDLALIAAKLSYRTDDHGDTRSSATALVLTGGTKVVSTTPDDDVNNTNAANKGILERNSDVDVFSFTTGSGPINLMVNPWIEPSGTRGGNLDLLLELRDAAGALIVTNNAATLTTAQIQVTLSAGTYYLYVRNAGTGDPMSSAPAGYTAYGSMGQYFIAGYVAPATSASATFQFTSTVNNSAWGSVDPTGGAYPVNSIVQVLATPAPYYRFVGWTKDASGTNNPVTLTVTTNMSVQAGFAELFTTNHPTPYWWLSSQGYSNDFENAANTIGANGLPLWESYLAGLDPKNPNSQLRVSLTRGPTGNLNVVNWNTVTGRLYTLYSSTNVTSGFTSVRNASNLPASTQHFTNSATPVLPATFYRLEVRKP